MEPVKTEILFGGLTYIPGADTFPLSTDAMALADFTRLSRDAQVLDLGSGAGLLGLLLLRDHPACTVTGLERSEVSHKAALENIRRNGLENRLHSLCGDVRTVRSLLPAGSFTHVITNPPYFPGGPGSDPARKELEGTLEDFLSAAGWALRFGGSLTLVHRPERLTDLMAIGRAHQLEAKELQLLRHDRAAPVSLVLISYRKGGKPGLRLHPDLLLHEPDGSPTAEYRRIYHLD